VAPKSIFRLFALLFLAAATYHLLGWLVPAAGIPGLPWRHALFVAIDSIVAILLLRPQRWLVLPFALLTLQLLYSHGSDTWRLWHMERRVAWISVGVVVMMPIMLAVIIREMRGREDVYQHP
jgi:hypothetical protein